MFVFKYVHYNHGPVVGIYLHVVIVVTIYLLAHR